MSLFLTHGFQAVSVDQIAEAAGVSPRSVFRYFPTKGAIVIESLRVHADDFMAALMRRPLDEPLADSLRACIAPGLPGEDELPQFLAFYKLLQGPSLQRAALEMREYREAGLRRWLARRSGKPAEDPRIVLLAAFIAAGHETITRLWAESEGAVRYDELAAAGLALLHVPLTELLSSQPMPASPSGQ